MCLVFPKIEPGVRSEMIIYRIIPKLQLCGFSFKRIIIFVQYYRIYIQLYLNSNASYALCLWLQYHFYWDCQFVIVYWYLDLIVILYRILVRKRLLVRSISGLVCLLYFVPQVSVFRVHTSGQPDLSWVLILNSVNNLLFFVCVSNF